MFENNTRYTLTTDRNMITETGQREIVNFLARQRIEGEGWLALNPENTRRYLPNLPADFDFHWLVQEGSLRGNFPKRVAQFYKKEYGLKLPAAILSEVGNIARRHTSEGTTYNFEFVTSFNWRAGAFGDSGSCYWGSNAAARDMLSENNALAICFFNDENSGIGRAWIARDGDTFIVFNGYGIGSNSTLTIARIFAEFLNVSYKKINLSNYGSTSGTLWINNGIGYAVGSEIENITSRDLEWFDYSHICNSCEDPIDGEVYYGPDDLEYCEYCFYDIFDNCEYCGEAHYREDITIVETGRYHEYLCERCLDNRYTRCWHCDEYYPNYEVRRFKDGEYYCEACYPQTKPVPK